MAINIVLFEPEIPPNTGNIARTCAAVGARLHLIEPLGFSLSDRYLKRAGLDYWDAVEFVVHSSFDAFLTRETPNELFALSTRGAYSYTTIPPTGAPYLLFGPETRGLPTTILERDDTRVFRIPMRNDLRSLNLSNSVAIVVYHLLHSLDFPGLT